MAEKLYYKDVNTREFDAIVTLVSNAEDNNTVFLDRTAFYPEGGGQKCDTGVLVLEDGRKIKVFDVQEVSGGIAHFVKGDIETGTKVKGIIDWESRFDHMQQHSGEHIVSGIICRRFNCDNVGFHMGDDMVVIDFNAVITPEEALEIEKEANQYIWENHGFVEIWPSADELKTIEYRSKKELEGEVRITSFPGADTCACCGTHVTASGQVGLVKLLSAKKFRDGTRIELLCGKRAYEYLSMNYEANKSVAVLLSAKEEKTPSYVQKVIDENISVKGKAMALENRLFQVMLDKYEAGDKVVLVEDGLTADQGRNLCNMIMEKTGNFTAVFAKTGEKYNYSIIYPDHDISSMVKEMNAALNGRGGGRNGFAQGSVQAEKADIEKFFEDM